MTDIANDPRFKACLTALRKLHSDGGISDPSNMMLKLEQGMVAEFLTLLDAALRPMVIEDPDA